jgi:hypothetical protein
MFEVEAQSKLLASRRSRSSGYRWRQRGVFEGKKLGIIVASSVGIQEAWQKDAQVVTVVGVLYI